MFIEVPFRLRNKLYQKKSKYFLHVFVVFVEILFSYDIISLFP